MDKQKQIEEMAKIISGDTCDKDCSNRCAFCDANAKKEATNLYNAGYRKITENEVVLTREEHQKYLAFKIIEPQVRDFLDRERELQKQVGELKSENTELYKEHTILIAGSILEKQDIVKDTAREICLEIVKDMPKPIKEKWLVWFKKRYGVEVE